MHIEDSYEGAVRRLARLSHGGTDLAPSRRDDEEASLRNRMRDLEALATLATEENERLEEELARARETIARLQEQLTEADRRALRELVEAPSTDEVPRRSILPWLAALTLSAAAVTGLVMLRPWRYAPVAQAYAHQLVLRHAVLPWAMPLPPAPPVVEAVKPVAAPLPVPAVAAPAPQPVVEAAPVKRAKHHAKPHRHEAPKRAPAKPRPAAAKSDADPLLGL